jgi:hypothetical protein
MAILAKNGFELQRLTYIKDQFKVTISIRSNGKVLFNKGLGWKLYKLHEFELIDKLEKLNYKKVEK